MSTIGWGMARVAQHCIERPDGNLIVATDREYEALRLAAAGLDIVEIAHIMGVNRSTVGTYIERWASCSGAQNRTMLTAWAILSGSVAIDDIWDLWRQHAPSLAAWKGRRDGQP